MFGFDGIRRGNYFEVESIGRDDFEVRVGKLKNGKAAGKDEVTRVMIKGGGNRMADWIWKLCNMAFENGAVPQDWRPVVIVLLYKGKREKTKCKIYRGISLLSIIGKIYTGVLVDRVHRVTGGFIYDEQGGSR